VRCFHSRGSPGGCPETPSRKGECPQVTPILLRHRLKPGLRARSVPKEFGAAESYFLFQCHFFLVLFPFFLPPTPLTPPVDITCVFFLATLFDSVCPEDLPGNFHSLKDSPREDLHLLTFLFFCHIAPWLDSLPLLFVTRPSYAIAFYPHSSSPEVLPVCQVGRR